MSVAYTPIDLAFDPVDTNLLLDYVNKNYVTNIDYTSKLCVIATRHSVNDWTDGREVFDKETTGYRLKDNYRVFFAPEVETLFPSVIDLISRLPYKQLIAACFSLHENVLHPHRDEVDDSHPYTPERYNVLLTPHFTEKSFFVSEHLESEKIYPTMLEEYPVYAFDNRNYFHGADPVLDKRVILVCAGVIDEDKHKALVDTSVEKFKDYVIRF
jgi:hypothetical protein